MCRILIAECKQEVSTFNPVRSRYEDFSVLRGGALLDYHRPRRSEVGGALQIFSRHPELTLVPTYGARFNTSGGTLAGADFQRIAKEFLDEVATAGPADGAYFCLHGAMAAENEEDPEGYLLAEARQILGEDIPFVVSLDLHGILTARMLGHSDVVVPYHTYPHVDFFETGERSARLLLRLMAGEIHPVTARVVVPALVRGDELITETGLFGENIRQAQRFEKEPGGVSAGIMIGNPFTDVPELSTQCIVTTDNQPTQAEEQAIQLAGDFWKNRSRMQAKLESVGEAVRQAFLTEGTVILVDAADATSSGASGDSNVLLRELLKAGWDRSALIPFVDPPAVQAAIKAGVGGTIKTTIGGAMDPGRFTPLPIQAKVRMLSDGTFYSESFGDEWRAGETAVLELGRIILVVTSRPVSLYDRSLFFAHGQNPRRFDLVVVKSPHCERHMFAEWCARLISVDAPGSSSANLPTLGHRRCARPMFPLAPDAPFHPTVELFQRPKCRVSLKSSELKTL